MSLTQYFKFFHNLSKFEYYKNYFLNFFFSRRVLQITSGMEDLGGVQWELLGCLILGWFIVYLIIWKGLHASGKVCNSQCSKIGKKCNFKSTKTHYWEK